MNPYRSAAIVTVRRWRAPDYAAPQRTCPKCGEKDYDGVHSRVLPAGAHRNRIGITWPVWCRVSWWRRLLRICPEGEHMHQRCYSCSAKWTTGLEPTRP